MFRIVRFISVTLTVVAFLTAADGQSYRVTSVSGSGTIEGTVKWSGPVPKISEFPVTKDQEICDPDSRKEVSLERLIIGADKGVANTVVYLKEISAGKPFDFPPPLRSLNQKHCRYEPHILLVPVNADVTMNSSDPTLHTIHMDGASTYNLPFPLQDRPVSKTMTTASLVNLRCNAGHVWMNGEMIVAPHPYYAVTDENGHFELTGVPPGQYELVAWHEGWHLAGRESTIDVMAQKRVERPLFTEPLTWSKQVTVSANTTTPVQFILSDKK